jgi:hypothetical protein
MTQRNHNAEPSPVRRGFWAPNHAKAGATSGDVDARVRAFCAANPEMEAIDAEQTVTGE